MPAAAEKQAEPPAEPPAEVCKECGVVHPDPAICKCGACLYANAKQIPDDDFPLFQCTKCKEIVFWD